MSSRAWASSGSERTPGERPSAANEVYIATGGDRYTRQWLLQIVLVASVLFWIVAWHWETASSMATIWWRSETFAHGMVVYPISIWLIWRGRHALSRTPVRPAYWVLLLFVGAGFGWLLGDLGGVQAARHFSLVAMIALSVWAILGSRLTRQIAFPLAYTLLAVPIGEFLLPILMEHTADFTVGALRLTGIPVYREGNDFVVPSGSWSVVEACSGLRYLIASLTLGLLYAYLSYRSVLKRVLFVLASIAVPIVANWVRAYMIVMIGHLSGMQYAVGVDHLIYGWLFFGVVMLILFWLGSFWREDTYAAPPHDAVGSDARQTMPRPGMVVAALLVAAAATIAPTYSQYLDSGAPSTSAQIQLPDEVTGWRVLEGAEIRFRPHLVGPTSTIGREYAREDDRVGVYLGYYARQREGAELISSQNTIVPSRDRYFRKLGERKVVPPDLGFAVVETRLASADGQWVIWHCYWTRAGWSADPRAVKLAQAANRLIGRKDDGAMVVVYARSDKLSADFEGDLRQFMINAKPAIEQALSSLSAEDRSVSMLAPASGR